jgi:hypothetical protein
LEKGQIHIQLTLGQNSRSSQLHILRSRLFFVGSKSSGSGALQMNARNRTMNYSKLSSHEGTLVHRRMSWKNRSRLQEAYQNEKKIKTKQVKHCQFTSSYSEEKLTFLSIVSLLKIRNLCHLNTSI